MLRPLALLSVFAAVVSFAAPAKPEYPVMGADIFDPKVSGEKLIGAAVTQAAREEKKVLIFFGANWCPWCRRLHAAFSQDPAIQARLSRKFILIHVDANTRNDKNRNADVLAKFGNPVAQHGLPVLVLLDGDGELLITQETASLAADTDKEVAMRVLALLDKW